MKRLAAVGCCLLLCGLLAGAAVRPVPLPSAPFQDTADQPEPDRVVEIVAERFLFTPSQITIAVGETVQLQLTSDDTDHGFRLLGPDDVAVDIDVTIPKRNRGVASVYFAPTEAGEYRFECSQICGAGHLYMSGVIRVTPATSAPAEEGGSR